MISSLKDVDLCSLNISLVESNLNDNASNASNRSLPYSSPQSFSVNNTSANVSSFALSRLIKKYCLQYIFK